MQCGGSGAPARGTGGGEPPVRVSGGEREHFCPLDCDALTCFTTQTVLLPSQPMVPRLIETASGSCSPSHLLRISRDAAFLLSLYSAASHTKCRDFSSGSSDAEQAGVRADDRVAEVLARSGALEARVVELTTELEAARVQAGEDAASAPAVAPANSQDVRLRRSISCTAVFLHPW